MTKKIKIVIAIIIVIIIISIGVLLLFNNPKDTKPKKDDNIAQVESGQISPIKLEGFTIILENKDEKANLVIENTSVKKDTAYKVSFIINQKEDSSISNEVTIAPNAKEKIIIPLNTKVDNIKNIEYKAEKSKTILRGSPEKKTEK